jgi:uncharacterized DUF497 family protein
MAYNVTVRVTWDRAKNLANQKKHGLSFEEARELFRSGLDYLELFDEDHSDEEDRFIAIGPIQRGLVLVVWTERDGDVIEPFLPVGPRETSRSSSAHTSGDLHDRHP